MLAKKQLKRIIATGISLALLLTSLVFANAEVNLTASATIEDADIIFEEPTVTTGSIGWKEQTGDSVNEVKLDNFAYPTGYVVGSNKLVGDNGLYKIAGANGNWNWTCMYEYDATAGGLKYTCGSGWGFEAAYKVDTKDYNVESVKSFEGRLYSSSFHQDNATVGVIINYIDSGNYDYIYPHIKHGSGGDGKIYIRYYSVRTTVVTENGVSYKQVYSSGQLDQDWGPEFPISSETINGEELYYVDFNIEYTDDGVVCKFIGNGTSHSITISNDWFMDKNITEIKSQWTDNPVTAKISNFGEHLLSNAKGVGFACKHYDIYGYVDNVNVTFNYNKSAAGAVDAYFAAHADALAVTADTVSKDNVAKVIAASTAYSALSEAVKTGILEKYNTDNGASVTDLAAHLNAIAKSVYYNEDGALIYDDMSGINADAWTDYQFDTSLKYINATADKTIDSVTYNYVVDLPSGDTNFKNDMMYYYQQNGSLYGSIRIGYSSGQLFLQMSNFINVNGNASYQQGPMWLDKVTNSQKAHISVTYDYDLATFYADASAHPNGSVEYAAKYIKVPTTVYVEETNQTETSNLIYVYPNENGTELTDKFSVGVRDISDEDALQLASIEITYAKSADEYSAEFEAYANTYNKTASAVTKDDATSINAAIAVYNGLDDTKKAVYAADYEALVALKKVADLHTEIEALTVTPASETVIEELSGELAALNVTNATVSASLSAKQTAFDAFRPVMHSATIKKVADEVQQDLRFKAMFEANGYSANIVSYGMVMVPNLAIGNNELVIGGSYQFMGNTYNAVNAALTVEEGEEMPSEFYGYLSNSGNTDNRCGTRVAARAYVVYEIEGVQYTLYSTASRNTNDEVVTQGVRNGVCVRSVYSIARAMATDLIAAGTYNETDFITATNAGDIADSSKIPGAEVIKFTAANVKNIENLVK